MAEGTMALRVRVTGRVQGVAYRDWARGEAEALGLAGSVRNEADGSVSLVIAGPTSVVDRMLHALWDGPPAAAVTGVASELTDAPDTPGFTILG